MLEGIAAGQGDAKGLKLGGGEVALGAPGGLDPGEGGGCFGNAVKFDAVAGAQNDQFAKSGAADERPVKGGHAFGAEGQAFAHGKRSAPMGGAEQKETGRVHGRDQSEREAVGTMAQAR